jgi:predicted peptidase
MYEAKRYYAERYGALSGSFAFQANTPEALTAWQTNFRSRLEETLGLSNMAQDLADHQPHAEQIDSVQQEGFVRQRWQLWVEPGVPLPFFLLQPDLPIEKTGEPLPLVLCPHGHNHPHIYVGLYSDETERQSIIQGERDIAVQAVKEGYAVIAPTTRGFGATRTAEDIEANNLSSCRTQLMHGLLLGRTPIGERVWDMSKLLDWALGNLNVDGSRVAITGNSGGGTVALFAAACDKRFSVAVPGSYFNTFVGSIGSIRHCDCNYIPGILRLGEMYDVAGLIAPRPFCAVAGEEDPIYPIEGAQYAYRKLRQIYAVAKKSENCRLYVGKGGHRYYSDGAWPFIRQHFQ